jgi:hypothetical protein
MADLLRLRLTSEALTGRKYRVEMGAAIYLQKDRVFTATGLEEILQIPLARVTDDLRRLKKAQLIRDIEGSGRAVEEKAEPHEYWEFCYKVALLYEWVPN